MSCRRMIFSGNAGNTGHSEKPDQGLKMLKIPYKTNMTHKRHPEMKLLFILLVHYLFLSLTQNTCSVRALVLPVWFTITTSVRRCVKYSLTK